MLNTSRVEELLSAVAGDVSRMSIASFESMASITKVPQFPKSLAWLVIKSYYAAFFASHAILRMLGTSCSQFDRQQMNVVSKIADLYGMSGGTTPAAGFYKCTYDVPSKLCAEVLKSQRVSHEGLWSVFAGKVAQLSVDVLSVKTETTSVASVPPRNLVS